MKQMGYNAGCFQNFNIFYFRVDSVKRKDDLCKILVFNIPVMIVGQRCTCWCFNNKWQGSCASWIYCAGLHNRYT